MSKFQNHGNMRPRNAAGKPSGKSPLQVIQKEARAMGSEAICNKCEHWTPPDVGSYLVDIGFCAIKDAQQSGFGICLKWQKKP